MKLEDQEKTIRKLREEIEAKTIGQEDLETLKLLAKMARNGEIASVEGETDTLRGVIDSLEESWAVIALDDEQRLYWPRTRLPADAKEGMAVTLHLGTTADLAGQGEGATWRGVIGVRAQGEAQSLPVRLGWQSLRWPATTALAANDRVVVVLRVDKEDTARRRQQVQNLVDDLFG
jgi:hypothetical protein